MVSGIFAVLVWIWLTTDIQQLTDAIIIPEVATVVEGDSSVFRCLNNNTSTKVFQIQYKPTGSNNPILLYSDELSGLKPTYAKEYKVEKSVESGYIDLEVLNVSAVHAGMYICDQGNGPETAELVVVVKSGCTTYRNEPQNAAASDYCGTMFKLECIVSFTGNLPPGLEFRMEDSNEPINSSSVLTGSNVSQNILSQEVSPYNSNRRYLCQPRRQGNVHGKSVCSFKPNLICNAAEKGRASSESGHSNVSWIAGVVIAVFVIAIVAIALLAWYCLKFKRRKDHTNNERLPLQPTVSNIEQNSGVLPSRAGKTQNFIVTYRQRHTSTTITTEITVTTTTSNV